MRVLLTLLTLFSLLAAPMFAQGLPRLFDVTGVETDDVLNMRASPRGTGRKVGELAPDATGIEVTEYSESGEWGRVNIGETTGWVSMEFMAERAPQGANYLEAPLICFGTEPFWSLATDGDGRVRLTDPGGIDTTWPLATAGISMNDAGRVQMADLGTADNGATLSLRNLQCSDGMSDAVFALSVGVLLRGNETAVMSGCCTLQTR